MALFRRYIIYLLNKAGSYASCLCRQVGRILRCRGIFFYIFQKCFIVLNLMVSLVHLPTSCFLQHVKHFVTNFTYEPSFLMHVFTLNYECSWSLISFFCCVNCNKVLSVPFRASCDHCTFLAILFAYVVERIVLLKHVAYRYFNPLSVFFVQNFKHASLICLNSVHTTFSVQTVVVTSWKMA